MSILDAIDVRNTVTLNHWELGRAFAKWGSDEQADFLHGLSIGLSELGGRYGLQLLAIRDAAKAAGTDREQAELIHLLHEYLADAEAGA